MCGHSTCAGRSYLSGRLELRKKRSPDWLRESETELSPLFENRNKLYKKWLSTGKENDKRKYFQKAGNEARKATRQTKNNWFQQKALAAQGGRHGGKVVWQCIRDMKKGRRRLVPLRTASVVDEESNICSTLTRAVKKAFFPKL